MKLEILTLDSKGRIVIPSKMLKVLSLSSEEKLVVYIAGDSIILKNKKYQGGKRLWNFTKSCKNLENKKI